MDEGRLESRNRENGNIESAIKFHTTADKTITIRLRAEPENNYEKTTLTFFMGKRVQLFHFDVYTDSLPVVMQAMDDFLIAVGVKRI
jgi:hypothetical protein